MKKGLFALRTVIRLKAGITPISGLEGLTINSEHHLKYLASLVSRFHKIGRAFGIVVGPYGSGKTHFLLLSKEFFLNEGFAVMHLGQDTGMTSLGHPQRHIGPLLTGLTLPEPHGSLFEWLRNSLDDANNISILETQFSEIKRNYPELREVAGTALYLMRYGNPSLRTFHLLEYLSGAGLSHKSSHPSSRTRAYKLLSFWAKFCTCYLGCKGIMVIIDELENLFSGVICSSSLARRAAYRTLSFYVENIESAIIVCALTPDGLNWLRSEIEQASAIILNYKTLLSDEDISKFCTTFLGTHPYSLHPLKEIEYRDLMDRLLRLHKEARGYSTASDKYRICMPTISSEMTPRNFSKSLISMLEAIWLENHK